MLSLMEQELRAHLEILAAAFARVTKREPSTVARLAAGDWRFFERLDGGASFTARKYDAILAWFGANWPEGAVWPADVPRPAAPANDAKPQRKVAA